MLQFFQKSLETPDTKVTYQKFIFIDREIRIKNIQYLKFKIKIRVYFLYQYSCDVIFK